MASGRASGAHLEGALWASGRACGAHLERELRAMVELVVLTLREQYGQW